MRRLKIVVIGLAALAAMAVAAAGIVAVLFLTAAEGPAEDSMSRAWLDGGEYAVKREDVVFVDASRPTAENRGVPEKPERTVPLRVWFPRDADGRLPLIIHSHGFLSDGAELEYVAEQLASLGYIFAAPDYPLTSGGAEGGPNAADVVNQPADISFLIDSLLDWPADERPFAAQADPERIGLSGYSLGSMTSYLATYHPRWRDPRIRATAAIAGLSAAFKPQFFTHSDARLLSIYGTADALIEFDSNGADMTSRAPDSALLVIDGGSHLGFNDIADPLFRFMGNPDGFACRAVLDALEGQSDEDFGDVGSVEEGIDATRFSLDICQDMPPPDAIHPGRQLMITRIAITSFFESVFAEDPARRQQAWEQLSAHLPADFAEISFAGAAR